MLDIENIPAILASLNGVDSLEARFFVGVPIYTYGGYEKERTYNNKKIPPYLGTPNQLKENKLMKHKNIGEFFFKRISRHDGIVTFKQVYAFDLKS